MGIWEDIVAGFKRLVPSTFWFVAESFAPQSLLAKFMSFIIEEAMQTSSMGLWQLVRNKKWNAAGKYYFKMMDMLIAARNYQNTLSLMEPETSKVWQMNLDAVEAQLLGYAEIIFTEGDPKIKQQIDDVYDWWKEEKAEIKAEKKKVMDVLRADRSTDIDVVRDEARKERDVIKDVRRSDKDAIRDTAKKKRAKIREDVRTDVITHREGIAEVEKIDREEREAIDEIEDEERPKLEKVNTEEREFILGIRTRFAEDTKSITLRFAQELLDLEETRNKLIEDIKAKVAIEIPERPPEIPPVVPPEVPPEGLTTRQWELFQEAWRIQQSLDTPTKYFEDYPLEERNVLVEKFNRIFGLVPPPPPPDVLYMINPNGPYKCRIMEGGARFDIKGGKYGKDYRVVDKSTIRSHYFAGEINYIGASEEWIRMFLGDDFYKPGEVVPTPEVPPPEVPPEERRIHGRVIDKWLGTGVEGAEIEFGGKIVKSDSKGYYEMLDPPMFSGPIECKASGYATGIKMIISPTVGTLVVNFHMETFYK